jgi:hypothetical protein
MIYRELPPWTEVEYLEHGLLGLITAFNEKTSKHLLEMPSQQWQSPMIRNGLLLDDIIRFQPNELSQILWWNQTHIEILLHQHPIQHAPFRRRDTSQRPHDLTLTYEPENVSTLAIFSPLK